MNHVFFFIVVIPAIGLFLDREPSAWERGNIVDYSLSKRSGLIFKSSIRNHTSKFQYPSLRERLYVDKIPKWSSLVVGETVLVEVQSNELQIGKIVSLTATDNRGGKVTVQTQENTREFDHNAIRIQGRCIVTLISHDFFLFTKKAVHVKNIIEIRTVGNATRLSETLK